MVEESVEARKPVQQFRAKLKVARITPRKLKYVADLIRGKSYNAAENILRIVPKRGAYFARKLLKSAFDNAVSIIREKNLSIDVNKLHIADIYVNEGPMFKRWRSASMGRSVQIKKRTSHLYITLEEREIKELRSNRKRKIEKDKGKKVLAVKPDKQVKQILPVETKKDIEEKK